MVDGRPRGVWLRLLTNGGRVERAGMDDVMEGDRLDSVTLKITDYAGDGYGIALHVTAMGLGHVDLS
jgi:hypothetical protein